MRRLSTAFFVLNVSLSCNSLDIWLITHHWDTQLIDNIYFFVSRPNRIAQVLWSIPINMSYSEFCLCHSLKIYFKFISECIRNYHVRKPILHTHSWQTKVSFHVFMYGFVCNMTYLRKYWWCCWFVGKAPKLRKFDEIVGGKIEFQIQGRVLNLWTTPDRFNATDVGMIHMIPVDAEVIESVCNWYNHIRDLDTRIALYRLLRVLFSLYSDLIQSVLLLFCCKAWKFMQVWEKICYLCLRITLKKGSLHFALIVLQMTHVRLKLIIYIE